MEVVHLKIGVKVEPTEEFSRVAYALGFVRVVPCRECEWATPAKEEPFLVCAHWSNRADEDMLVGPDDFCSEGKSAGHGIDTFYDQDGEKICQVASKEDDHATD